MYRLFIVVSLLSISLTNVAQQPAPSQSEINKMIEEAMKQQGMTEAQKTEMRKSMEQANELLKQIPEMNSMGNIGAPELPVIPPKQTATLSKIPVINSETELTKYTAGLLGDCKKNISATIIKSVDDFFAAHQNNEVVINNAGAFLLLQQNPLASVYASVKSVSLKPAAFLLQNNLAVILIQTGYPEFAIPLLQYLLVKYPLPEIYNNLAQCYLSLGDIVNAKKYFIFCIQKNPDHVAAHSAMALILSHEGNIAEATVHVKKALKNGYSESAEALMNKHKMKITYPDIKPVIAEYFNPQKYKPVSPATSVDDVEMTDMMRNSFNELYQNWQAKSLALSEQENQKKEQENIGQNMNRVRGYVFKTPLSRKAKLITDLLRQDYYNFFSRDPRAEYMAVSKSLYKDLEAKMKAIDEQAWEGVAKDCERRKEVVNKYLLESAKNHEAYQNKTVFKHYDWINQNLQWMRFLLNGSEYRQQMYELITEYFRTIDSYSDLQQIYPIPRNVAGICKNVKPQEDKGIEDSLTVEEEDCPIKIEIPLGAAKAKFDCNGYEIEGGELIIIGVDKKYKTGEMTFFLGLGVEAYAKGFGLGGIEAGAKAGSFVTIGKDFSILDCGNKAEAGIEGGVGPFMTEVKLTGTMGMESGIKVDRNVLGTEKTIFQYGGAK